MKKILMSLITTAGVLAGVAAFGAFEGHVINVKATIENALSVSPLKIDFGTVFPQEYLTHSFDVKLSDSFMKEDRADDVAYVIKQKAKPRETFIKSVGETKAREWCHNNGTDNYSATDVAGDFEDNCYPMLCEYISMTPEGESDNDTQVAPFHRLDQEATGYLSKLDGDVFDSWIVDLAVPCFGELGNKCAQDWPDFVAQFNKDVNPWEWTLPLSMEHETFGCDIWVEVTGISRSANLYEETGDESIDPGAPIGLVTYDAKSTGVLSGTVRVNSGYLNPAHNYLLVLNGPRNAATSAGSTNDLLASKACSVSPSGWDSGWDGWWSNRTTDNSGVTDIDCNGYDGTTELEWMEGYYNFEFSVSAADLMAGHDFTVGLNPGTYTEVQFLIKDLDQGWATVAEHPATGEGNVSTINFVVE